MNAQIHPPTYKLLYNFDMYIFLFGLQDGHYVENHAISPREAI